MIGALARISAASALALMLASAVADAAPRRTEAKGEPAAKIGDMGGRYAVLRDNGKDTGCMITFDEHTRVSGGNRAALAPACRDQGIVVFDPMSWRISGSKLVLTARKGHSAQFDLQPGGAWLKEGEGKPLALKKF